MLVVAHVSAETANTTYLWIWVGIGVVTLIGFGIGAYRWVRQQGAADERLENRLRGIEKKLTPNGLNTDEMGDMMKRTENKVDALTSRLDQHIGMEEQARRDIWRELRRIGKGDGS